MILVAIAGKFGGSLIAAHWAGISWPDSFSIGAFINTRGLMDLVVLNIVIPRLDAETISGTRWWKGK